MKNYIFNYNGNPNLPKACEENINNNQYVKIKLLNNLNFYYIDDIPDENLPVIELNDKIALFLISTSNSAHSISEIIDFINYYNTNNINLVAISKFISIKMPFLYELITIFIPENKIIILEDNKIYKIKTLLTYRNIHFNYLKSWNKIPFTKEKNTLYFNNLENIRNDFVVDSTYLFDKVKEIYNENKEKYKLYDNIMLIKTSSDKYIFSENRCMEKLDDSIIELINNNNIKILSINDFQNIYEYICIFYHAKNIIVSYGGVACTNRFFCNENANIILIANIHYQHEYEYDNINQLYWHVRHSHIYPAKTQKVLLDFDNNINTNNFNEIISLLE